MICMIELGKLEGKHEEFDKRNTRIIAVSVENQETAQLSQKQFPHLAILSDADRKLGDAFQVIHQKSAPDGQDTEAPTTILLDGTGTVRWLFRPSRVIVRLSPEEMLAAVDQYLPH